MTAPRRLLPLLSALPPAPRNPQSGSPRRALGSIRRTGHWNMTWPAGIGTDMHIAAAARDLATTTDGRAEPVSHASLDLVVDPGRQIRSLSAAPGREDLDGLVGIRGGSGFRRQLQSLMPEEMAAGSLSYFLLDDMPGITLVGPFAWRLWPEMAAFYAGARHHGPGYDMTGICAGFRPDGLPIERMNRGEDPQHNLVPALDLDEPSDPLAWHEIPEPPGDSAMLRRRRRIDVIDGPELLVDSVFRDSMWSPEGVETVVHEYGLHARVDRSSQQLTALTADPRVLPFQTCPSAASNVDLLVGEPMATLRHRVLELVVSTDGCTHLNDALRALAVGPVLAAELVRAEQAA
ncbi:MAG: hypothetical protein JWR66_4144 [Modestobacter sp.]|nr:hypothetical protein [Modestobacter sp.]